MKEQKIKYKWYCQWWFIIFLLGLAFGTSGYTFGFVFIPFILRYYFKKMSSLKIGVENLTMLNHEINQKEEHLNSLNLQNEELLSKIYKNEEYFKELEHNYIEQLRIEYKQEANSIIEAAKEQAKEIIENATKNMEQTLIDLQKYTEEKETLEKTQEKLQKTVKSHENKLIKLKTEFMGIQNLINTFPEAINYAVLDKEITTLLNNFEQESLLHNLVELDCHYLNSKELRKEMNRVKKELNKLLDSYVDRYSTKANRTIYQLMVIGLQSELQNILYTLSYSKYEEAQENARNLIRKYLAICAEGNNSILPTITRFLTELEPIFLEAIEVEYHYYIKREQEKEEQRLIREQMREEAAERKALAEQQKKLEQEEAKYAAEMNRNRELLQSETNPDMIATLEARIRELEEQQNKVAEEKEEILKRANGKAGYVYVISNLGSFGDKVFKIGMTRRLDPMERIDELGDASVPFRFDVHAMIFSDNAVDLEKRLHEELALQRVNKVNLRKEFFETTIDDLQQLVESLDPTVEFRKTLVAQEYFRSLEIKEELMKNQIA